MPDFKTTGGAVIVELDGVARFLKVLADASEMYLDGEVRAAYMGAGKGIADAVRREAPVNKYPYASNLRSRATSSRPGLLRRSIVGKAFNLTAWRRWGPGAFAQVTLRRGAMNRAPHANIIQPGRKALTSSKHMVFVGSDGRMRFTKRVAAVPANDFWKRGVRVSETRGLELAKRSLERAWNKRVAK